MPPQAGVKTVDPVIHLLLAYIMCIYWAQPVWSSTAVCVCVRLCVHACVCAALLISKNHTILLAILIQMVQLQSIRREKPFYISTWLQFH